MPIVRIDILKRPLAAKRKLAKAVTTAIVEALGVAPESVHLVIGEMAADQYAVAGTLHKDKTSKKTANRAVNRKVKSRQ